MAGTWVRKRVYWWQYYIDGQKQPVADVIRQDVSQYREGGPDRTLWDALPMARLTPLVEDVTLEEAKAAVEHYTDGAQHGR